jgi:hypothetical protein
LLAGACEVLIEKSKKSTLDESRFHAKLASGLAIWSPKAGGKMLLTHNYDPLFTSNVMSGHESVQIYPK